METAKDFLMARFRDITLRQLRALAAVDSCGTLTSAAHKLNLTQPAVTLQIKGLQDLIGLPLIQRTSDGMILTAAGREVLAMHGRMESALADCRTTVDMLAGSSGGRVTIAAVSTAKYFVPFAIAGFLKRFPGIDVSLQIGNREEVRDALRGYELDIAIMGRPPADVDVEIRLIGEHPHTIVAPATHRLARKRRLKPSAIADEVFITREQGSGTRMLMEQFFSANRLQPKVGMEMSSNETIKQAVIANLGIAFISKHTVANELADGRLVTLDIAGLPVIRNWHVARRHDKILLPPAQAMLDFLGREGARFLP